MFSAECSNWSANFTQSDYWRNTVFTVCYDGTIEGYSEYNLSGKLGTFTEQLSDEDYDLLFDFLSDGFIHGKYDVDVEACDGAGWYIKCYDTEGEILHKYDGYIYGVDAYEDITKMLYSYQPEFEEPPLFPGEEPAPYG
jgi:hypothetical protein